jgi:p-aminobenzoyl-glutamate transporter AbgT
MGGKRMSPKVGLGMLRASRRLSSIYLVASLLLAQLGCFWLSLNAGSYSIFCTGASTFVATASPTLSWLFGLLHLSFIVLLFVGGASMRWPRLRRFYLAFTLFGLCLLPVQSAFVEAGRLTCDGP